jgi:hypothetical protein
MAKKAVPRNWSPESDEDYEVARSYLKVRFAEWCEAKGIVFDGDPGEAPIHYKGRFLDGHLTRWRCGDLDEVYLELHPAKVIVEEEDLGSVLVEAKAFMTFLAETGLLDEDSDNLDELVEHLEHIERRFMRHMADPARYSFGKRLVLAAASEGIEPGDEDALRSFMDTFNARPRAERDALFGPRASGRSLGTAGGRITAPGTRPRPKSSSTKKRRRGR